MAIRTASRHRPTSTSKSAWLTASLLASLSTFAALDARAADLDYARTIREGDMIFVPYEGENRGPVYYTRFQQRLVGSSRGTGALRRIVVELVPSAHAEGRYLPFVRAHGIRDARVSPTLGNAGACRPTPEIEALLAHMPAGARPTVIGPNYPQVCSLNITVPAEDVDDYLAIIADRPVLTLDAEVPFCAAESPSISVSAVVEALVADGALSLEADGDYSGNMWDVLYASTLLSTTSPALFGAQAEDGWRSVLRLFTLDTALERATLPAAAAGGDVLVCIEEPLHLQFPSVP